MAAPEPRACPRCGSMDTEAFADGSGACRACGNAFRGPRAVLAALIGDAVDEGRGAAKVQEKDRLGLLGIVGGVLGYLGIPGLFLIGAAVNGRSASEYVGDVTNTSRAAIVCGGLSVLVVAATYALWAGSLVWRGSSEKSFHLLLAGVLCTAVAAIAGPGPQGIVGILGGVLALVGGFLVWRRTRVAADPAEENAPPSGVA